MRLPGSLLAKIALMLALPLLFELTVISVSIHLLNQIDQARVERQRTAEVVSAYVNVIGAVISDYIGFAGFIEGREKATKQAYNQQFIRTNKAWRDLEKDCRAAGFDVEEIRELTMKSRWRLGMVRTAPDIITADHVRGKVEAHALFTDILNAVNRLVGGKTETLRLRESRERELFFRMNAVLLAALSVSLLLTVGLCLIISKMIIDRLSFVGANTKRLARQEPLLPPLRGDDEIIRLDKNFRVMADSLARALERDQAMLDNSIDVICALDAELCFKRMSKSGEFLFRVQSGALIDKPVTEITGEKWQVSIIKHFDQARKSGAQTSFENETVNSEGESIPSLWSVQWSQEDELFICVIHDLTERKQAELRRQELLALVSHDLRSPLTASRLRLEAIFMLPDLEPQLKADLSRVNRSISDVIATTSDLLDLMRFEGAKVSLELKLSTIGDVERRLRQYLDAEAADYSLTVETRAEVYVMVEEDFLPRMIHALVKHARLARRDRPVDIAIGCDDASESIFIRVEPSEFRKQAEHCDEPESEAATRISFEVSLALCSEIAQRLHGNLKTYWSDSGRPSYQINLPRVSLR